MSGIKSHGELLKAVGREERCSDLHFEINGYCKQWMGVGGNRSRETSSDAITIPGKR